MPMWILHLHGATVAVTKWTATMSLCLDNLNSLVGH